MICRTHVAEQPTNALGGAVRLHLLNHNPATEVRKPKADKTEMKVLDPDQVATFLKAAMQDRLYAFFVMALDSGMRPGELFALEWSDINFDDGHVLVTKSLEELKGRLRIKDVNKKRPAAHRPVPAYPRRAERASQVAMLAEGHERSGLLQHHGYLPASGRCGRLASFKPILVRAKLPDVRLYTSAIPARCYSCWRTKSPRWSASAWGIQRCR